MGSRNLILVDTSPKNYPPTCKMGTFSVSGVKRPWRVADCRNVCSSEDADELELFSPSLLCLHRYVMGWPLRFTLNGIIAFRTSEIPPVAIFEMLVLGAMKCKSRLAPQKALCVGSAVLGASSFNRALSRDMHTTFVGFSWAYLKTTQCAEWVMTVDWHYYSGQDKQNTHRCNRTVTGLKKE